MSSPINLPAATKMTIWLTKTASEAPVMPGPAAKAGVQPLLSEMRASTGADSTVVRTPIWSFRWAIGAKH
jgi:hypothetical protein